MDITDLPFRNQEPVFGLLGYAYFGQKSSKRPSYNVALILPAMGFGPQNHSSSTNKKPFQVSAKTPDICLVFHKADGIVVFVNDPASMSTMLNMS